MGMQNFKDEQRVAGIEESLELLMEKLDTDFNLIRSRVSELEELVQKMSSEVQTPSYKYERPSKVDAEVPFENMALTQFGGTCGDIEITNPTSEDLARVIGDMVAAEATILSDENDKSGQTFLQVCHDPASEYQVEYRDGSADEHYQVLGVPFNILIQIFIAYANRDVAWLDGLEFHKLDC